MFPLKAKLITTVFFSIRFLIGGCNKIGLSDDKNKQNNSPKLNDYELENYVPIQEYNGEGYILREGKEEVGEVAEEHCDVVKKTVH